MSQSQRTNAVRLPLGEAPGTITFTEVASRMRVPRGEDEKGVRRCLMARSSVLQEGRVLGVGCTTTWVYLMSLNRPLKMVPFILCAFYHNLKKLKMSLATTCVCSTHRIHVDRPTHPPPLCPPGFHSSSKLREVSSKTKMSRQNQPKFGPTRKARITMLQMAEGPTPEVFNFRTGYFVLEPWT